MKAALAKCAAEGQTGKVSQRDPTERSISLAMPMLPRSLDIFYLPMYTTDVIVTML